MRSRQQSGMRRVTRVAMGGIAVAAMVLAAAVPLRAAADGAGTKVGPGQRFVGHVNGRGGVSAPVVIRMACAGPIQPGETGHPMGGQTVAVLLRGDERADVGHTGPQTTSIGAFFNAPPPGAARASSSWVDFTRYGTRPIPRSLTLPCSGMGYVYFVPLPTVGGGGSRSATVPVRYVGQP